MINNIPTIHDVVDKLTTNLIYMCSSEKTTTKDSIKFIENVIKNSLNGRIYPTLNAASNICLPEERFTMNILLSPIASVATAESILANEFKMNDIIFIVNKKLSTFEFVLAQQEFSLSLQNTSNIYQTKLVEDINTVIGNNNLFKRTLLFIKAWCSYELPRFLSLLKIPKEQKTANQILTTDVLVVMTMSIFVNQSIKMEPIASPYDALIQFLTVYSSFNWNDFYVTYYGFVRKGTSINSEEIESFKSNSLYKAIHEIVEMLRMKVGSIMGETHTCTLDNNDCMCVIDMLFPDRDLIGSTIYYSSILSQSMSTALEELNSKTNKLAKFPMLTKYMQNFDSQLENGENDMTLDNIFTPSKYIQEAVEDHEFLLKRNYNTNTLIRYLSFLLVKGPLTLGKVLSILSESNFPGLSQEVCNITGIQDNDNAFLQLLSHNKSIFFIDRSHALPNDNVLVGVVNPRSVTQMLWYNRVDDRLSLLASNTFDFDLHKTTGTSNVVTTTETLGDDSVPVQSYHQYNSLGDSLNVSKMSTDLGNLSLESLISVMDSRSPRPSSFLHQEQLNANRINPYATSKINRYDLSLPLNATAASLPSVVRLPQPPSQTLLSRSNQSQFQMAPPGLQSGGNAIPVSIDRYDDRLLSTQSLSSLNLNVCESSSRGFQHSTSASSSMATSVSGSTSNLKTPNGPNSLNPNGMATVIDPLTGEKKYNPNKPEVWKPGKFSGNVNAPRYGASNNNHYQQPVMSSVGYQPNMIVGQMPNHKNSTYSNMPPNIPRGREYNVAYQTGVTSDAQLYQKHRSSSRTYEHLQDSSESLSYYPVPMSKPLSKPPGMYDASFDVTNNVNVDLPNRSWGAAMPMESHRTLSNPSLWNSNDPNNMFLGNVEDRMYDVLGASSSFGNTVEDRNSSMNFSNILTNDNVKLNANSIPFSSSSPMYSLEDTKYDEDINVSEYFPDFLRS